MNPVWLIVLGMYAVASGVTFALYALDKSRAGRGGRRIPEKTLHTAELLGGWPGALLAMRVVRHKNRKLPFLLVTAAIVVVHAAGWALVVWLTMRRG